jgi:hypothetical protein
MSRQLTFVVGLGLLTFAAVAPGCGVLDDLIDDLRDPKPDPQPPKACLSSVDCSDGKFCTTETGVCNPPPGCGGGGGNRDIACPAVCYGTCEPKPAAQCRSDSDCRAFAFMCTGCDCLALGPGDPEPMCPGPGVQCFADPCLNKKAVCTGGRCAIASASACGPGFVQQTVCLSCGIAGGCARSADCARTCTGPADCAGEQTGCVQGLCQVVGCI